jgi:hypothetical protein
MRDEPRVIPSGEETAIAIRTRRGYGNATAAGRKAIDAEIEDGSAARLAAQAKTQADYERFIGKRPGTPRSVPRRVIE